VDLLLAFSVRNFKVASKLNPVMRLYVTELSGDIKSLNANPSF
jgi:hypothetical protein